MARRLQTDQAIYLIGTVSIEEDRFHETLNTLEFCAKFMQTLGGCEEQPRVLEDCSAGGSMTERMARSNSRKKNFSAAFLKPKSARASSGAPEKPTLQRTKKLANGVSPKKTKREGGEVRLSEKLKALEESYRARQEAMQERVLALENKLKEREAQTTQARCDSRGVPVQSHVDSLHRNAANLLYRVLPAGAADSRNSRSSDTQSHNSKRRKGIPRQGSEQ